MFIQSETQIEVRYYETDLMGIVHHSNYIRYFECGRHQFLLDVGLPITELEKSGIMMPVVSVEAHYHTPARMGDILRVVSRVEKEPMARIEVLTDIYNQNGDLVCDGTVVLGFIHSDTRRPQYAYTFVFRVYRTDRDTGAAAHRPAAVRGEEDS